MTETLKTFRWTLLLLACLAPQASAQNIIVLDAATEEYAARAGDVAVFNDKAGVDGTLWRDPKFRSQYAAAASPQAKARVVTEAYDQRYAASGSLSFEEILRRDAAGQFIPSPSAAPNMSFQKSVFWYKVRLDYRGPEDRTLIMTTSGFVRDLQIYAVHEAKPLQTFRTGSFYHPAARPLADWGGEFGAPIKLSPGLTTLYYKVHSDGTTNSFNFHVWSEVPYNLSKKTWYMAQGIYFGSTMGLLIYNLFIFFVSGQVAYLLYALFLGSMVNEFLLLETFSIVLPDLYGGIYVTSYFQFSTYTALTTFNLFLCRFMAIKRHMPGLERFMKTFIFLGITLFAVHFFLPAETATDIVNGYCTVGGLIFLTASFLMAWKKERNAFFFLGAFTFMLVGGIIYTLFTRGLVPRSIFTEYSFQIGSFLESLLLSVALGDRLRVLTVGLRAANNELRQYIGRVEELVEQKTRNIRLIMTHIKQGIFGINRDGTIHEDYSKYLEDIIGQGHLEGRDAIEVFLRNSNLSADDCARIHLAIDSALESALAFEMNLHHLPREVQYAGKLLELDWQIITSDRTGETERLLVVVRDVTLLRELELGRTQQEHEMVRIMEVINATPQKALSFFGQCRRFLREHASLPAHGQPDLRNLFIHYHTLKGIARSLQFREIVDLLHDAETICAETQKNLRPGGIAELRAFHGRFERVLEAYERTTHDKLGRRFQDEVRLDRSLIESSLQLLDELPREAQRKALPLRRALFENYYMSMHHLFQDVFAGTEQLARDLGKPNPHIVWPQPPIFFDAKGAELLRNVLVHLLRNALDHGIESADERQTAGKAAVGRLTVEVNPCEGGLEIIFKDDGRGLALERLRREGIARNLLPPDCDDVMVIANLIFHPGLSTARETSDLSGRGVGLDAAKSFLAQAGGSLDIRLPKVSVGTAFVPISFRLFVPERLFHTIALDEAV